MGHRIESAIDDDPSVIDRLLGELTGGILGIGLPERDVGRVQHITDGRRYARAVAVLDFEGNPAGADRIGQRVEEARRRVVLPGVRIRISNGVRDPEECSATIIVKPPDRDARDSGHYAHVLGSVGSTKMPWCNGKTDSECGNGVKGRIAIQAGALV